MTDSEEWKLTCLARHLLRMPLADRREFLERWRKNHGAASEARVKAALQAEWNARNSANPD